MPAYNKDTVVPGRTRFRLIAQTDRMQRRKRILERYPEEADDLGPIPDVGAIGILADYPRRGRLDFLDIRWSTDPDAPSDMVEPHCVEMLPDPDLDAAPDFVAKTRVIYAEADPSFNGACAAEPPIGTVGVVLERTYEVPKPKVMVQFKGHALGYETNAPVRLFILRTSLRPA